MKKLLALALALVMALSLTACGDKPEAAPAESAIPAPAENPAPDTAEQEPSDAAPADAAPEAPETTTPDAAAPEAAPGEVTDFDIGISAIPAEWQKAIGNSMFGMNTGSTGEFSDSYTNKFGGVSAEDYAKLIAYFDTLAYTEKLDGVYNCDWGQLQIGHNAGASEMTISWYAN